MRPYVAACAAAAVLALAAYGADDILLADFEGADYGEWKAEGEAFGAGPARGTLPGQMQVSGFQGKGLVNSFLKGDKTTGTLTSPDFTISRKYVSFLVGGGGLAGKTCVNLLVEGKVVRTAAGPNTQPGGSEKLEPAQWEVGELQGKTARIQVVDDATEGWGHVNFDHVVLTDRRTPAMVSNAQREMALEKRYLNLPVKNKAGKRRMTIAVDGAAVRKFDIELADAEPDFWAFVDMEAYKGKTATITVDKLREDSPALKLIEQGDTLKGAEDLYREKLRPQFHFTQKRGWNNDPNGMVYYKGEYHLYYQHNPYGTEWANMHWGHAVSKDLVHWQELPIALYPWTMAKDHCFSGSAAVDWDNTGGFQTGDEKTIVAAFTDTGCGEALAFSNDRGRTFTYYQGNPVFKHGGRDPKILWYKPGKHWVMACYDERQPHGQNIAILTSQDLKTWNLESHIRGYFECPEIFELAVDGKADHTRWVIYAADAKYAIGRFDGKTFTPDHEGKHQVHWGAYYASQTFSDAPDGRRIQIGWGRINMEGMPFNQMLTFPCELSLRTTEDGIRMFAKPVKEIELLHARKHERQNVAVRPGENVVLPTAGELFDIRAEFEVGQAKSFGLNIAGRKITYNAADGKLEGMPLKPVNGKVRMQVLVDRSSIEVCGNDGRVCQTNGFRGSGNIASVEAFSDGGEAKLTSLEVCELKSAWE